MKDESAPLAAEQQFRAALIEGDAEALDRLLAEDFALADLQGGEQPKAALLALIRSGQLNFEAIEPVETRARLYGRTAVITGRTQIRGRFAQTSFAAHSRFTHVFIEQRGRWLLVAAQGTPIAS